MWGFNPKLGKGEGVSEAGGGWARIEKCLDALLLGLHHSPCQSLAVNNLY